MEQLLHYCWKHRLFPLQQLTTSDGQVVEVISAGLSNPNAGPDFLNARVKIDGRMWAGNVEIHQKSSQWYSHSHDRDARYNNVILHVVEKIDRDVFTENGTRLPQMQLSVPDYVANHYAELLKTDKYPPCYKIIPSLSRVITHAWLSSLTAERLERKTNAIRECSEALQNDWEAVCFSTLARNFGFSVNSDAFEVWSHHMPLNAAVHHRDNPLQIEALFFGQAGLLDTSILSDDRRKAAEEDAYFQQLKTEYRFLANKFSLSPMDGKQWKFLRLRPQNFPTIRLSQLANLYCSANFSLSKLTDCATAADIYSLFNVEASDYWRNHYLFGVESKTTKRHLSRTSIDILTINTVVPLLFAYGRYRTNETLCDRALNLLEQIKTENNHIVRMWQDCGLKVESATDSQALIQLKKNYCDRRDCLRCRFGFEYMKQHEIHL